MEGFYANSEHDDDDDDKTSGAKKKRAENIGAFAVEPKKETEAAKKDSWLDQLTGRKAEKPETEQPDAETDEAVAELSEEEAHYAEREIVLERQAAADQSDGSEMAPQTLAAELAVERFRDKIVIEDKPSEQALAETLNELSDVSQLAESPEAPDTKEPESVAEAESSIEFTDEPVELNLRPAETVAHDEDDQTVSSPTTSNSGLPLAPAFRPAPGFGSPSPASAPETVTVSDPSEFVSGALVGGIVGYLLGRRRGRIKTERRLLPIQQKLEAQVERLQQDIITKELSIRQAAIEHSRQPISIESAARRASPIEIPTPAEKMGDAVITAQADARPRVERVKPEPISAHIETLSRADLLELSSKIVVEGASLRQAYETNLISEKALRRVVGEYVRGGDVNKALRRELVERQIDFERDPLLRDKAHALNGSNNALNDLLQQVSPTEESQPIINQAHKQQIADSHQQKLHASSRRMMDIVMVTTIGILLAMAIVLAIIRA